VRWLPWAEYTYNTAFHTTLQATPFWVVYRRDPPYLRSYDASEVKVVGVAQSLAERDEFVQDVHSWNKPSKWPSCSMIANIVMSVLLLVSGPGSAYTTVPMAHWQHRLLGSFASAILGRIRLWRPLIL
jgi:hypothetical protein